jgi:hypothetical protein
MRRASAVLSLLVAVYTVVTWRMGTQHWLAVHTGTCPVEGSCNAGSGPWYAFWSGFGSDLGEYAIVVTLLGHTAMAWRTGTCHRYWWCWRHPHYLLEGTPYKLCRVHHPDEIPTVAEAVAEYASRQAGQE